MFPFCVVLFFIISSDASATRLYKRADDHISSSDNSTVAAINKTADNNSNSMNNTINLENAAANASVKPIVPSVPVVLKTVEKSKPTVKGSDQEFPLNGLFAKSPSGAALRGLYVFVGLSAVVMLYITVKIIRLKRKKMRIRKYGLIANADDVEMTPLEADDDEEDTTLFDAHNHIGR